MICPLCKKNQTSIVSDKLDKKNNTVKRKRYCICGNLFSTFEKFQGIRKKRKIRPSSYWKNERIYLYGIYRYNAAVKAFRKGFKSIGVNTKKIYNPKTKTYLFSADERIKNIEDYQDLLSGKNIYDGGNLKVFYKENKGKAHIGFENNKKTEFYKVENKKKTISNVIKSPFYWEQREYVLGKAKEDQFNKDKIRKEIDEFYKLICSYVKDKQFNQDFFIKRDPELKWFWTDDEVWKIYTTVR
jgi:hypothetical protein